MTEPEDLLADDRYDGELPDADLAGVDEAAEAVSVDRRPPHPPGLDPDLAALADAYGVATAYEDWAHRVRPVAPETVVRVLGILGVDASSPGAVRAALHEAELAPWRRLVAPTVVVRQGALRPVVVRVPFDTRPTLRVRLEDGRSVTVTSHGPPGEERPVDEHVRIAVPFELPPDLPLGWHRLDVTAGDESGSAVLVVAPPRVGLPAGLHRAWGWMVQLYSVRSALSWGMGDYGDLAELVRWSGGEQGAGVLLCNPLHAVPPVHPIQPSPYYPGSRRFRSPLYLRIEDTPEYAAADPETRAQVDALGAARRRTNRSDRIDRDAVWDAKRAALELLWPWARDDDARAAALSAFRAEQGRGIENFALFCALAERHGVPWQSWPPELRRADSPAVRRAGEQLRDRVDFHAWLQLLVDEQLAAAATTARSAGMPVGVVHDLAVGVDPGGADGWALQDDLAMAATVGAPPDSFNQQGQDWRLPPWRPGRLAEIGYAPYRDMLRGVLRHAGGVRIDHIMGLFRLWWVPEGGSPADGTYVRYDEEALLGVLALEAHRAGAVVVGEDLGTVEPRVSRALAANGILGSAVLWFERAEDPLTGEDTGPLPPRQWREPVLASVTTHDLPTAAGFLTAEHVRVRAELAQLGRPVEEEQAQADREREQLIELLRGEGLLGPDPSVADTVLAMHALLARTPARLVLAALGDAVGDVRQPNLPGTVDEYPNWRLPVAAPTPDGPRPLLLEDLQAADGVRRLAAVLHAGTRSAP